MSVNSNYMDSSSVLPLIAFLQLDRALSSAQQTDVRSRKNCHFKRETPSP